MAVNSAIATAQSVREAAEALLSEGWALDRISQQALRNRLGGGSMGTIHRHLKQFLDEKRADMVDHGDRRPKA